MFVAVESETYISGCLLRLSGNHIPSLIYHRNAGIIEIFLVVNGLLVIDVGDAYADTPVDYVVEVTAEVDLILVYKPFFLYIEVGNAVCGSIFP